MHCAIERNIEACPGPNVAFSVRTFHLMRRYNVVTKLVSVENVPTQTSHIKLSHTHIF